jgi:hypothetical protein
MPRLIVLGSNIFVSKGLALNFKLANTVADR